MGRMCDLDVLRELDTPCQVGPEETSRRQKSRLRDSGGQSMGLSEKAPAVLENQLSHQVHRFRSELSQ